MSREPFGRHDSGAGFRGHSEYLNVGGSEGAREIFEREAIIRLAGPWCGSCGVERQAEAAILPIGEQDDRFAAFTPAEKYFRGREINSLLDIRAADVA